LSRSGQSAAADWPGIWPFVRRIVAEGTTFCWDPDLGEQEARELWFPAPLARTIVAVDQDDHIVGIAAVYPNHDGPGRHVASANFMVDRDHPGRGIGRLLGEHILQLARADGYAAMQFNAVVETNTRAVRLWRSLGFEVLATAPQAFHHRSTDLSACTSCTVDCERGCVGLCTTGLRAGALPLGSRVQHLLNEQLIADELVERRPLRTVHIPRNAPALDFAATSLRSPANALERSLDPGEGPDRWRRRAPPSARR